MTNTYEALDVATLKQKFQEMREQLESPALDPDAQRILYRELKALQYTISMKEAAPVYLTLDAEQGNC